MKRFLTLDPGALNNQYFDQGPQNSVVTRFKDGKHVYGHAPIIAFVETGGSLMLDDGRIYQLHPWQYFAALGPLHIAGANGIMIEPAFYRPQFLFGGPVEPNHGRLKYIDGCTDSLLIPPVKFGDPCRNALYFPPGINQTQHTHPSLRAGLVIEGEGTCLTPEGNTPLVPGVCFIIETDSLHYFATPEDSGMIVIAYHPDSDFGPQDENHPMVNRTIVEGVPANQIESILTK